MRTPRVVTDYVSWLQLLAALECKLPDNMELPRQVPCVMCNKPLFVYPDIRSNEWLHCETCGFTGDTIEYAMKVWGLDLKTTLSRLLARAATMSDAEMKHFAAYIDKQEKRENERVFCQALKTFNYKDTASTQKLHLKFSIPTEVDRQRWQRQMSSMISFSSRDLMAKQGIANPADCLIIPFHHLPGKVSGYHSTTLKGSWAWNSCVPKSDNTYDAGLGFYHAVTAYSKHFENVAFAIGDPEIAMRIHCKWFKDHDYCLPLALYADTPRGYSHNVYRTLRHKEWIFWAPAPCASVFAQAVQMNGKVCIRQMTENDMAEPRLFLNRIQRLARPWVEAFEHSLARLKDSELIALTSAMRMLSYDWIETLNQLKSEENKKRLRFATNIDYPATVVALGKHVIVRHDSKWLCDGCMITDAPFIIEKVTYGSDHRFYMNIKVTYQGSDYRFEDIPESRLRDKPAATVMQLLVANDIGVPQANSSWDAKMVDIALLFHRPDWEVLKREPNAPAYLINENDYGHYSI